MSIRIDENCQFIQDLEKPIKFNGNDIPYGLYNLLISIRDFKLYRSGLKPHRHWKPTETRKYFGLRPRLSTDATIAQLENFYELVKLGTKNG